LSFFNIIKTLQNYSYANYYRTVLAVKWHFTSP